MDFWFSLGACSIKLRNLVSSLGYLVSNGRRVILGGIRLGGSTTDGTEHRPASHAGGVEAQPAASHDERQGKQTGGGATFPSRSCALAVGCEHGSNGGGDPSGDG